MDQDLKAQLARLSYEQLKKLLIMPVKELADLIEAAYHHKAFNGGLNEVVVDQTMKEDLTMMLRDGLYIDAIRYLRSTKGLYLKESKQYVDNLKAELGL